MKSRLAALSLLSVFLLSAQQWQLALPGYRFEFPRDHFSHPAYQTEWWYYTGNLQGSAGHRYGFELTFFRQAQPPALTSASSGNPTWQPDQIYLAHLAFSDLSGQTFYHAERLHRAGPGLAGAGLADGRYWNGNWQVRWTSLPGNQQSLVAVSDRFTLTLDLRPLKAPVIQGQGGVSRKGPARGEASHYVSFTRIAASGRLQRNDSSEPVAGVAWMDHEFFTEPPHSDLAGWDWFAIQLDSNEELMLYRLRTRSGVPNAFSSGSYVDPQGAVHFLAAADFTLTPGQLWQSPHSQTRYPVVWNISVPALRLSITAETALKDQELWSRNSASPPYWEGAVTYRGTLRDQPIAGRGYLEMTGYGEPISLGGMTGK